MRLSRIIFTVLILLYTGCSSKLREETILTPTPFIIMSTLATTPTLAATLTETMMPFPAQPTTEPVEGITSTQINVRAAPSTASKVLGIIPANTKVEITGKDPGEAWWQINSPQGFRWNIVSLGSRFDRKDVICILQISSGGWDLQMDQITGLSLYLNLLHLIAAGQIRVQSQMILGEFDVQETTASAGQSCKNKGAIGFERDPIV